LAALNEVEADERAQVAMGGFQLRRYFKQRQQSWRTSTPQVEQIQVYYWGSLRPIRSISPWTESMSPPPERLG